MNKKEGQDLLILSFVFIWTSKMIYDILKEIVQYDDKPCHDKEFL
jgi:hypothetical protein